MSKWVEYEIPGGLKAAQQQFEQWRSSHSGRRPIPEPLWSLAATLAKEHGVFRTAQVLRLDYTKLKRQAHGAVPSKPSAATVPAAFVEFMAPTSAQGCECVIEVEGPRGRMRIEWKGPVAPDLASLSRMLWEPGV